MPTESDDHDDRNEKKQHRRSGERYQVAAPVWFRWQFAAVGWRRGKGITRDISGSGMFILSFPVPVPGALIEVMVDVPRYSGSGRPITFRGRGQVVRIEPQHGQPIGFAASVVFEEAPADQGNGRARQEWWRAGPCKYEEEESL